MQMALHVMDEANRCLGCKGSSVSEGMSHQYSHSRGLSNFLKANKLDEAGKCFLKTTR